MIQVLRDNLGDDWDEACATLMTEMRMYELECLRSGIYLSLKNSKFLLHCLKIVTFIQNHSVNVCAQSHVYNPRS